MRNSEVGYWLDRAQPDSMRRVAHVGTRAADYWRFQAHGETAVKAAASVACELQMIVESFPRTPNAAFRGL